jgi:AbrB family looped-hinge helix DNA binding protein
MSVGSIHPGDCYNKRTATREKEEAAVLAQLQEDSRITLPKAILERLGFSAGDQFDVSEKDGALFLKPVSRLSDSSDAAFATAGNFTELKIPTKGWKFDREEANER